MLSVSNSLPVSNYATKVVSLASGTAFRPKTNGKIRIDLPSSLGMVDFHSSYLQFKMRVIPPDLAVDGTVGNRRDVYNMELSNEQGAEQIIRDLRVMVDNKPVEEIQHYNVLHKFKKDFMDDNSKSLLDSTFNHGEGARDVDKSHGYFTKTYDPTTPSIAYDEVGQKQVVTMGCSGVLSLPVGFPVLATGKVGIEITLEDAERVLKPKGRAEVVPCDATTTSGGGVLTNVDCTLINGTSYEGYGWQTSADCPFSVGNTVRISASVADLAGGTINRLARITAVADAGGRVRLTLDATNLSTLGNNKAVSNIVISAEVGVDQTGAIRGSQYNYEITEVEYVVRSIDMPPPYLQSLQRRIQQDAFMLDVPTYSSYLDNIQANLRQQSINIPCYSSRVKSVISIPVNAVSENYRPDRNGSIVGLREFQAQIGTRREPNRPVDLTNTTSSGAQYPSQEYLYELKKVFKANGEGVRTLKNHRTNFAFTRCLSAMGGSEDLTDKGFRFNVEYNTNPVGHNVYSFVYHTKRLQVTPAGLMVFS